MDHPWSPLSVIASSHNLKEESFMTTSTIVNRMKTVPRILTLALISAIGVSLAIGASVVFRASADTLYVAPPTKGPRPSEAAVQLVTRHLAWADEQSNMGLDAHLAPVREFFDAARSRTKAYATEVLGWESKFALATDYVNGGHEHEQFMKERFAAILFSEADLEAVVEQAAAAFLTHVNDVESQMLVNLEADLANLGGSALPAVVDRSTLNAALQTALQEAATAAQADFRGMVGREIVSWVAAEVLTVAAAQLATSAGILGTGAASSWGTFGAGIVVGLIVDAVVTEIYNQQFDPIGELSRTLDASLSQMESLILQGTSDSAGLHGRLHDYSSRRNVTRREAIQKAVLTSLAI
ncbi:MAG: hypothetical protein IAG10_23960 [Planctomycetaceae bacterium]|nr:hypothetical protein [Planctomycetaceae bacterium]